MPFFEPSETTFTPRDQREVESLPDWVMADARIIGSQAIGVRSDLIHHCVVRV